MELFFYRRETGNKHEKLCDSGQVRFKKIKNRKEKKKQKKKEKREQKGKLHKLQKPTVEAEVFNKNRKCD